MLRTFEILLEDIPKTMFQIYMGLDLGHFALD